MKELNDYYSNTLAANGNQTVFFPNGEEEGMVFIKPFLHGKFEYAFAFSPVIDSTFADGSKSRCNDICESFTILSAAAAVCSAADPAEAETKAFVPLLFGKSERCTPGKKKIVLTSPAVLATESGEYICIKIRYCGEKVPCHAESIIPVYKKINGEWKLCPEVPLPVFTGVKREAKLRIGFMGDSITQGIGTEFDSYAHSAAVAAGMLGEEYAFWDLGIGYARGADAATDGIWLEKAKLNDIVTVCYGVNDMFQGRTVEQIKADLSAIIKKLKEAGVKVLIQTVPPFDYGPLHEKMWREVNTFIRSELKNEADAFFDTVPVLSQNGGDCPRSGFGPHPNNEGNRRWGEKLCPVIKGLIKK